MFIYLVCKSSKAPAGTDKLEREWESGVVVRKMAGGHSVTYHAVMGKEDFKWSFALCYQWYALTIS